MNSYNGKTVLITGASSGIGESFAREFARQGANLVLVARSEEKLRKLGDALTREHGIRVTVICADLAQPDSAAAIYERTVQEKITVDVLVNNAGFATHGYFDQLPLQRQSDEITVNVTAVVELTHHFLPGMVARQSGAIINVSSTSAFQPVPYMAVYAASKAFVLSFSEALWEENRNRGVYVLALCPGSTETPFFEVVGAQEASVGKRATPQAVVDAALRALGRKQSFVIEGRMNNFLAALPRLLPRSLTVKIVGQTVRPQSF
jgi:short-subunit dehydrogenase